MSTYEIAKEVLAVSLHIAESHNFDLQETKKRMKLLTESVLKTSIFDKENRFIKEAGKECQLDCGFGVLVN